MKDINYIAAVEAPSFSGIIRGSCSDRESVRKAIGKLLGCDPCFVQMQSLAIFDPPKTKIEELMEALQESWKSHDEDRDLISFLTFDIEDNTGIVKVWLPEEWVDAADLSYLCQVSLLSDDMVLVTMLDQLDEHEERERIFQSYQPLHFNAVCAAVFKAMYLILRLRGVFGATSQQQAIASIEELRLLQGNE